MAVSSTPPNHRDATAPHVTGGDGLGHVQVARPAVPALTDISKTRRIAP